MTDTRTVPAFRIRVRFPAETHYRSYLCSRRDGCWGTVLETPVGCSPSPSDNLIHFYDREVAESFLAREGNPWGDTVTLEIEPFDYAPYLRAKIKHFQNTIDTLNAILNGNTTP
jgi:hypothetical protein